MSGPTDPAGRAEGADGPGLTPDPLDGDEQAAAPEGAEGPDHVDRTDGTERIDGLEPIDGLDEIRLVDAVGLIAPSVRRPRRVADPHADPGPDLSFGPWFVALVPRLGTVVRCHLPGGPLDARRRELVGAVVSAAAGSAGLARLHADWHDVLGPAELSEVDDDVLAWALGEVGPEPRFHDRAAGLPAELAPAARRAVEALVAHGVVAAATAQRVASAGDRVRGRLPRSAGGLAGDLLAGAVGLPVTLPVAAAGSLVGLLGRVVPAPAAVEVGSDPNLLAQLLAETLPTWLGSAWGRTLVARLPVEVPVAVRSGLTGATVRIGRGRLQVANGLADDAWALFDGDIDSLLRAGSHTLTRELRSARFRG